VIEMKAILPGNAPYAAIKAVRNQWTKALNQEGDAINAEYAKTYSTWEHKPSFKKKLVVTTKEQYVQVSTEHRIYWFVHESVSVLRAVFSPDWSPKTQPRVLSSGAGSGRMLYASKKIAKPPYEARKFTDEIIKVRQKPFQEAMEAATGEGLAAARMPRHP